MNKTKSISDGEKRPPLFLCPVRFASQDKVMNFVRLTGLFILFSLIIMGIASAEEFTNEQIANAIYKAEGGAKAEFAYGIRSIGYSTIAEARRICLNTIRNNRKRYADYGYKKYSTYLDFLASRYCPINCDNDRGTNKFWLSNVKYFLQKGRG